MRYGAHLLPSCRHRSWTQRHFEAGRREFLRLCGRLSKWWYVSNALDGWGSASYFAFNAANLRACNESEGERERVINIIARARERNDVYICRKQRNKGCAITDYPDLENPMMMKKKNSKARQARKVQVPLVKSCSLREGNSDQPAPKVGSGQKIMHGKTDWWAYRSECPEDILTDCV